MVATAPSSISPQKPDKVCVVFDCSAKYRGTSLNDQLLQGPDLTNTLVGVLTRFSEEQVAFMSDIEVMFYQVRVTPRDCNYLRFLWWPKGDLDKEPEEYQMLVHLFGRASSPSCANYALKKRAEDNKEDFIFFYYYYFLFINLFFFIFFFCRYTTYNRAILFTYTTLHWFKKKSRQITSMRRNKK